MIMMCSEFQSSNTLSVMPELLLDVDKALQTSRQLKLERCNSISKLCEQQILRLNVLDNQYSELKSKQEYKLQQLLTDIHSFKQKVYVKENEADVLRNQIKLAKNKTTEAILNVPNEEELSNLMKKVCLLQSGIESVKKLFKHELTMYQKGILFYKTYFSCNVIHVLENNTLIFTLNSSAKVASDACEFIKFTTRDNGNSFQYVDMQPKLKSEQVLLKRYQETSDIQGFILAYCKALKARRCLNVKN